MDFCVNYKFPALVPFIVQSCYLVPFSINKRPSKLMGVLFLNFTILPRAFEVKLCASVLTLVTDYL